MRHAGARLIQTDASVADCELSIANVVRLQCFPAFPDLFFPQTVCGDIGMDNGMYHQKTNEHRKRTRQ